MPRKPSLATAAGGPRLRRRDVRMRANRRGNRQALDHDGGSGRAGWAARLMAIVAEGSRGRAYLNPSPEHNVGAASAAASELAA